VHAIGRINDTVKALELDICLFK